MYVLLTLVAAAVVFVYILLDKRIKKLEEENKRHWDFHNHLEELVMGKKDKD